MKKLSFSVVAVAAIFSTQAHSQEDPIIFEQESSSTVSIPADGGMVIELDSQVRVIVPRRETPHGKVRIGSRVITSDNRDGKVSAMFLSKNQVVVYNSSYGNQTWKPEQIAVTSGCIGPYCVGDKVITSNNRYGEVSAYFGNGKVVVYDSSYGYLTWKARDVGVTDGCSGEFCVRDQVITSDNRKGEVSGFLPNGKVIVYNSSYGYQQWNPKDIAMTQAVCTNIFVPRVDFCHH